MKRLLILVVTLVVTLAMPETYREKEDFQYARSSTDEGSKSGFYGAQRGNMGGNYERAHNMDTLAQHQMSGVVRQVEGELGDAVSSRRGNVFSSASTRGMYGQGNYDLSNLAGRNFQEGTSYADTQSASYSTASRRAGYTGHSSSYFGSGSRSASSEADNLQSANYYHDRQPQYSSHQMQIQNNAQGHRAYEHSVSEHSASEHHQNYGQSNYETNNRGSRYNSDATARILVQPTSSIMGQAYDDSQRSHSTNADAEVLNNYNSVNTENRPRHFESSYNYRKEWERHNIVPAANPLAITTERPNFDVQNHEQQSQINQQRYATNSRLMHNNNYDSEASRLQTQEGLSTSHISGNARSNYQSNYDADYNQRHQSSSSALNSNMYSGHERHSNSEALQSENQESIDSRPKTYQSSYSYHKSWERQGDPYTIRPVSGVSENLQALNSGSSANRNAYASHQYGSSQYRQSHQSYNGNVDCDEDGHIRVARSYQSDYEREQRQQTRNTETQQRSNHREILENFDQQSQNNDFQDMGQQTQTDFGQLEDFGQQTQDLGQQIQTDFGQLEDFGQQTQGFGNLEDFGQQIQGGSTRLEDLGQQEQTNFGNLEDFGQHTYEESANSTNLEQQTQAGIGNLQDFGQQIQEGSANLEDLGQQPQSNFGNFENFGQHTQSASANLTDLGQQTQTSFGNLEEFSQQSQKGLENLENFESQTQTNLQNFDQQSEDKENFEQLQGGSSNLEDYTTEKDSGILENFNQQIQNRRDIMQNNQYDLETMNQQAQKELSNLNNFNQQVQAEDTNEKHGQQETQTSFSNLENTKQQSQINVNNINLEHDGKEDLESYINGHDTDNTSKQEQSTFDHNNHINHYLLPIEYYETASQFSSNGVHRWNENNHDTHEHNYYHTSNSDSSSSRNWWHSQVSQNNHHVSESNQQTNNVQRTSDIDNLWDEIYDLMADNQTSRKNNETEKNKEKQNMLNNTKESLFTNVNNINKNISQINNSNKSQDDHSNINSNNQNKPTSIEPVRSSNFGRGDIESNDFPDSSEFSTENSISPIVYTNENPRRLYKILEEIETLSLINESTTRKENINEVQFHINNQFNEFHTNDEITNVDKNKKVTELLEQVPEEVRSNEGNVYQSLNVANQQIEGLEQQRQINENDSLKDEKLDMNQQVQSSENVDFGQEVQTIWNTNEDSVQQIQTAWNPTELEQQSEQDFEQRNFNVLPYINNQNLEQQQRINVSEQTVYREQMSNLNNEPNTYQNLNNPNNSTTELVNTTLESVTEKAGFWHSVGNKFSNAKDKIVSWFHRS